MAKKKEAELGIPDLGMIEEETPREVPEIPKTPEITAELGNPPESEPEKEKPDKKEPIAAELALRRYIKRTGGFRVGISKDDEVKARNLMKKLGRDKPAWDLEILP